jgi:translocator protein
MSKTGKFIVSLLIPLAVAMVSGLITAQQVTGWYVGLNKPSWNPPNWLFGPVWSLLYLLMGIALYLVWSSNGDEQTKQRACWIFGFQLLLNFFWSIIFFKLHLVGLALVEIIMLWFAILATIFAFARVRTLAAWLLVPYISWVSFALILNLTIYNLNK